MRRLSPLFLHSLRPRAPKLVQIENGTFFRQHPSEGDKDDSSSLNPPLFRNLNFDLPASAENQDDTPRKSRKSPHWAIIGTSGATTFLEILRGTHICVPPNARTFPYLSSEEIAQKDHRLRVPSRAIQYVGFNPGKGQGTSSGVRGAYLSARYESRREETDWSVIQYLKGETDLNPLEDGHGTHEDDGLLKRVITDLRLEKLVDMPVSNLSNGQTRRARIARALLGRPELLLLDEPFMGLDPPTLVTLSPMLRELAFRSSPSLLLALRPQDPVPDWITHLIILGANHTIALMGEKWQVLFSLYRWANMHDSQSGQVWAVKMAQDMTKAYGPPLREVGHTLTAKGVIPYNPADIMKRSFPQPKWYTHRGAICAPVLSDKNKTKLQNAMSVHWRQRSLEDWLTITSIVPEDLDFGNRYQSRNEFPQQSPLGKESASSEKTAMEEKNLSLSQPLIELSSVVVKYGDKTVLGHPPPQPGFDAPGLNLTICRGTRLALLGPNGSGKTTLLSLLTSDHPHSYSLPIKFFGRSRLPSPGKPGLSLWEIQSRIGHSSPEIHAFFPKRLNIRQVLESAWAETFGGKPKLTHERDRKVDSCLRWWEPELRQVWSTTASSAEEHEAFHAENEGMDGESAADHEARTIDDPNLDGASRAERTPVSDNELQEEDSMDEEPAGVEDEAIDDSEATSVRKEKIPRQRFHQTPRRPSWNNHALFRMAEQSYPPPLKYGGDRNVAMVQESEEALEWAEDTENHAFGLLPFGTQRLLLLLRALIKEPDILVLDEAFSGLGPEIREKAMCWLEHGERFFLQRQLVYPEGQRPDTEFDDEADEEEFDEEANEDMDEETGIASEPDTKPSSLSPATTEPGNKRSGRPRNLVNPRPQQIPGRPFHRPLGSKNAPPGKSAWVSTARLQDKGQRWETTRVRNMRDVFRLVGEEFQIDFPSLARKKNQFYLDTKETSWDEFVDIAERRRERLGKDEERNFWCDGLSDQQALVVVSHVREEVPGIINEWVRLPGEDEALEQGKGVEMGTCTAGEIRSVAGWEKVWGLRV